MLRHWKQRAAVCQPPGSRLQLQGMRRGLASSRTHAASDVALRLSPAPEPARPEQWYSQWVQRQGRSSWSNQQVIELLIDLHGAAAPQPKKPVTWDQAALQGWQSFKRNGLASWFRARLGSLPRASNIVWSCVGMFVAVLALGLVSLHVKELPGLPGEWHKQGLGLLLGSFGTLCVLLFSRPEAEPIRMWNLVVGHLASVTVVMAVLKLMGPGLLSRAVAMSAAMAAMMATDSVHPPGGALVLMAVDSTVVQSMQWWFLLYPSLFWTFAILLPLGLATNWAKSHLTFDWPRGLLFKSTSPSPSSSLSRPTSEAPASHHQPLTTPFSTFAVNGNGNGNGHGNGVSAGSYSSRDNSVDAGSYGSYIGTTSSLNGHGSGLNGMDSSGLVGSAAISLNGLHEMHSADSVSVHISPAAAQLAAGVVRQQGLGDQQESGGLKLKAA